MKINQDRCVWLVGEILIQHGWLNWEQLDNALAVQKDNNRRLGEILVGNGLVARESLYEALGIQAGMRFVDIRSLTIPMDIIQTVPKRLAYEHHIMPLIQKNETLVIAISSPTDVWPENEIQRTGHVRDIRPVLAFQEQIDEVIERYYGPEGVEDIAA